ncbi:MAG: hypothetical protein R3B90_03170 [Planctomycetaceae bacterium]
MASSGATVIERSSPEAGSEAAAGREVTRRRQRLVWLLRLGGVIEACAFFAVVTPRAWLAEAHADLGLGDMPAAAVLDFMIRQSSFVYGMHGLLLWFVASDVVRFAPVIRFLGLTFLCYSAAFLVIDWWTEMPVWWTICDPIATGLFGWLVVRWGALECVAADEE